MARGVRKVLRVGAVRGGRIVVDRLVELNQPVVLGVDEGLDCSPGSGPWTLFAPSGRRQHVLRFTEDVQGRVQRGDEVLELSSLRDDPYEARSGQGWALQLDGTERGRLVVGGHVLLFHYVEAGRRPVRPWRPRDFRPPLLAPGDSTFVGFLGVSAALATAMVGWVAVAEPAPVQRVPEISPQVRAMAFEFPPAPEVVEVVAEAPPREVEVATPAPVPEAPDAEVQGPLSREEALVQLRRTSPLVEWIAHRGEGGEGGLRVLSGSDTFASGDLDAMVGRLDREASLGPRWLEPKRPEETDIDIDDLGLVGGGLAVLEAGPEVRGPEVTEDTEDIELEALSGDRDQVARTVRGKSTALRYCYEKRLKEVPGLSGRIEAVWNLSGGRVHGVELVGETTGDDPLVDCVLSSIETWRFPPGVSGEVTWPFVFRPSAD